MTIENKPLPKRPGTIAVVCAGTSDLPVAEEAAVTAEIMGNRVERITDVGVAGVHRLFGRLESHSAGERDHRRGGHGRGAAERGRPGLVSKPVIAVPTSVGYGANFGGLAPLLGMLNSCASGLTVVNIDNGFGAGYAASQINALAGADSMKTLYLDLFSGISGDMFIAALIDLGVDARQLERELKKLRLEGYHLHVARGRKASLEGVKFDVHLASDHDHEEQPHAHGHHRMHAHASMAAPSPRSGN